MNAFPNLTFVEPLHLSEIPGGSELLLVCKNGRIWRFDNDPATIQSGVVEVLNWSARTQTGDDMGFYSLSFHPEFGQQGSPNADYVYVCYSHRPADAADGPEREQHVLDGEPFHLAARHRHAGPGKRDWS